MHLELQLNQSSFPRENGNILWKGTWIGMLMFKKPEKCWLISSPRGFLHQRTPLGWFSTLSKLLFYDQGCWIIIMLSFPFMLSWSASLQCINFISLTLLPKFERPSEVLNFVWCSSAHAWEVHNESDCSKTEETNPWTDTWISICFCEGKNHIWLL